MLLRFQVAAGLRLDNDLAIAVPVFLPGHDEAIKAGGGSHTAATEMQEAKVGKGTKSAYHVLYLVIDICLRLVLVPACHVACCILYTLSLIC